MIKFMLKHLIDLGIKYIFLIFATVLKNNRKEFHKLFIFIYVAQKSTTHRLNTCGLEKVQVD